MSLQSRNAFWTAILTLIGVAISAPIYLYAAVQLGAWQLYGLFAVVLAIGLVAAGAVILCRRGRSDLGIGILLASLLGLAVVVSGLLREVGLLAAISVVCITANIAGLALSPRWAKRLIIVSSVEGIALALLDALYPPGFSRFSLPDDVRIIYSSLTVVFILALSALAARQFVRHSLRAKIVTLFMGSITFLMIVVGAFFLSTTAAELNAQARSQLESDTAGKRLALLAFLGDEPADVLFLSHSSALERYLAAVEEAGIAIQSARRMELTEEFRAFAAAHGIYDQVRFIDPSGQEVIRVNTSRAGVTTIVPPAELQNKADRPYFRKSIRLPEGCIYVSALDLNVEQGQIEMPPKPVLRYVAPVYFKGRVRGIVVINVLAEDFLAPLSGGQSPAFLVDADGYYLYHPEEEKRWGRDLGTGTTAAQDFPELTAQLHNDANGVLTADGYLFAYSPITLPNESRPRWFLVSYVPESAAAAPVRLALVGGLGVLAGALAVAVLFASLIARAIASPLQGLTRAAERMAAGELTAEAVVRSEDELGILARAFNAMAASLHELISSLEARVAERTAQLAAVNRALSEDIIERKQAEAKALESEARYKYLVDHATDIVYQLDMRGRITFFNPAAVQCLKCTAEALTGFQALDLVQPADRAVAARFYRRQFVQKIPRTYYELRVLTQDGAEVWLGQSAQLVFEAGQITGFYIVARDITAQRQAEAALRAANEQLKYSLTELEEYNREIALLNQLGEYLQSCADVSEAYEVIGQLAGQLFAEIAGALCVISASLNVVEVVAQWGGAVTTQLVFAPDDCWALRRGRGHLSDPQSVEPACRHVTGDAATHLCIPLIAQSDTLGVLYLRQPAPLLSEAKQQFAQTVADNISLALASLKLRETLRNQSIRDPLTGLFNRRYMEESLNRELHRAARDRYPVSIIMLDLDHFKRFNDTFGHVGGDALLRALGALLEHETRSADIACRYGGEEFTLILPEASLEVAAHRAEWLREAVKQLHVQHDGQSLGEVTLSLGVSAFPTHGLTGDSLLKAADGALYRAKREGRDRVIVGD